MNFNVFYLSLNDIFSFSQAAPGRVHIDNALPNMLSLSSFDFHFSTASHNEENSVHAYTVKQLNAVIIGTVQNDDAIVQRTAVTCYIKQHQSPRLL